MKEPGKEVDHRETGSRGIMFRALLGAESDVFFSKYNNCDPLNGEHLITHVFPCHVRHTDKPPGISAACSKNQRFILPPSGFGIMTLVGWVHVIKSVPIAFS